MFAKQVLLERVGLPKDAINQQHSSKSKMACRRKDSSRSCLNQGLLIQLHTSM